jgi:hypothetical protein
MLTKDLAARAVEQALPLLQHLMDSKVLKRPALAIVILKPGLPPPDFGQRELPMATILYERQLGRDTYLPQLTLDPDQPQVSAWERPFDLYARQKALLTARTGLPSRLVQSQCPHLLMPGNIVYGGSTIKDGLIVACSGVQSWYDEAIAEIIASLCLAAVREVQSKLPGDTVYIPQ